MFPHPYQIGGIRKGWHARLMRNSNLDPISHAAILHAQFEAIHPYGDGNGRLGRTLVTRALRRAGLTRHSTVPISVAIARDTGGYLSGLHLFEQGRAGPWFAWFAGVTQHAAAITDQFADRTRHIIDTWQDTLSGLRADSASRALAPLLVAHPLQSAPDTAALLHISRPAASARRPRHPHRRRRPHARRRPQPRLVRRPRPHRHLDPLTAQSPGR